MRLGKFAENKINFRDSTNGRRGMQWSNERRDTRYRMFWAGRIPIPARGTATNMGGSVRIGRTLGGNGNRTIQGGHGSYAQATWAHGIASVGGAFVLLRNGAAGQQRATAPGSYLRYSIINASTIRVSVNGYTAATLYIDAFIWGSTTKAY